MDDEFQLIVIVIVIDRYVCCIDAGTRYAPMYDVCIGISSRLLSLQNAHAPCKTPYSIPKPPPHSTDQTLALLGAIVRLNFRFSSVSSITGNIPLSLNPAKNICPYAYPT